MPDKPTADMLRKLAVEGYFSHVVARDMDGLMANIADNATMIIPPLGIEFDGHEAVHEHFAEFLDSYRDIAIDEFRTTADPDNGTVAVRFRIALTSATDGSHQELRNCNFFDVDAEGKIERITIYMSALPSEGFTAGAQQYGEA